MTEIWNSYAFYGWQILHAIVLGCLMATIGILIVLRSQASYGLLAAQAAVSAGLLNAWIWGLAGLHLWALPISLIFSWPFYAYSRRTPNSEAVLLGGMLFYVGLGEVLAAMGHFRMHLMQSWFGDVLTTAPDDLYYSLFLAAILMVALYHWFDRVILFCIDPQYAQVSGLAVKKLDALLFVALTLPLAWSILKIGMFVSMGQLILPSLAVLGISRSPQRAILYASLLSILANLGAFTLSFMEWPIGAGKITLPTSSLILVLLGIFCICIFLYQGASNKGFYFVKVFLEGSLRALRKL